MILTFSIHGWLARVMLFSVVHDEASETQNKAATPSACTDKLEQHKLCDKVWQEVTVAVSEVGHTLEQLRIVPSRNTRLKNLIQSIMCKHE